MLRNREETQKAGLDRTEINGEGREDGREEEEKRTHKQDGEEEDQRKAEETGGAKEKTTLRLSL